MQGVLVVERIVLECLEKYPQRFFSIQRDTGLNHNLLINVLSILLMRGMIHFKNSEYSLNLSKKDDWVNNVNDKTFLKVELKELFSSLVNEYYKKTKNKDVSLNVQKVWLTREERKKLQAKLEEIKFFLRRIENKRKFYPQNEITKEKQILIWGASPYHVLIDNIINNV